MKSTNLWNFRHFSDDNKANPEYPTWFIINEEDMPIIATYRLQTEELSPVVGQEITPEDLFEWGEFVVIDEYKIKEKQTLKLIYFHKNYKTIDLAREIEKHDPSFEYKEDKQTKDLADNLQLADYLNVEEVLEFLDLQDIDGWFQDKDDNFQQIVEVMLTSKGKRKIKFVGTQTFNNYLQ